MADHRPHGTKVDGAETRQYNKYMHPTTAIQRGTFSCLRNFQYTVVVVVPFPAKRWDGGDDDDDDDDDDNDEDVELHVLGWRLIY